MLAAFSQQFRDFILLCLCKEPEQRPSAEELLKHEFIRMYDDALRPFDMAVRLAPARPSPPSTGAVIPTPTTGEGAHICASVRMAALAGLRASGDRDAPDGAATAEQQQHRRADERGLIRRRVRN